MSKIERKPRDRKIKYILLFMVLLSIGLGVWKYLNLLEKESSTVVNLEEEGSLKEISKKSETKILEDTFISTKSESKMEETLKDEIKQENNLPIKEPSNDDVIVYRSNKSIDKRRPAFSNTRCNATKVFRIDKSTIQVSVDFSPNGLNFAVGGLDDYVSIMDMEGKEILKLIGHTNSIQSVKYSPDGKFIVTGSGDHSAKIWDASNGKELKNLKGHTDRVFCVAYSPNGKYIATAGMDKTAILWDPKSGEKLFQLQRHTREVSEVTFSNDSKLLLTGSSDNTANVWDVKSGKILFSIEEPLGGVSGLTFTKDDKLILTGGSDKKIRLWETKTGKHIHTISGHKGWINAIKISLDGENILSTDLKGVAKIWEIKGGKEVCEIKGHTERIREAAFHPVNKNIVASVGNDKTIRMWKVELE